MLQSEFKASLKDTRPSEKKKQTKNNLGFWFTCLCEEQGMDQNAQHAGAGLKNVSIRIPPHTLQI